MQWGGLDATEDVWEAAKEAINWRNASVDFAFLTQTFDRRDRSRLVQLAARIWDGNEPTTLDEFEWLDIAIVAERAYLLAAGLAAEYDAIAVGT